MIISCKHLLYPMSSWASETVHLCSSGWVKEKGMERGALQVQYSLFHQSICRWTCTSCTSCLWWARRVATLTDSDGSLHAATDFVTRGMAASGSLGRIAGARRSVRNVLLILIINLCKLLWYMKPLLSDHLLEYGFVFCVYLRWSWVMRTLMT